VRQDDTPIHQVLREALVNTLVHADYNDRASILVVKEPSGFLFRNPGLLRVPVELAIQGGASDCRNRTMQQMFLMIGLGERAGSGLPKIIHGWQDTGHFLQLRESFEPYDHSVLEMLWARRDGVNDGVNDTGLDKIERNLLERIRQNKNITLRELAAATGTSLRSVERKISKLKQKHLRRIGSDKTGHWDVLDAD
jgi:predicted HTH transcriptional regulator